jgi:membrane-bound serine protease (ClpP class)
MLTAGANANDGDFPALQALPNTVVRLVIDGGITPAIVGYVKNGIEYAESSQATAIMIELDSRGGLLDSTRQLVHHLLAAGVPTIAYIAPSAGQPTASGLLITMAADIAAMAQGTYIGVASPLELLDEDDAAAFVHLLAENQNRNYEWVKHAVNESKSISAAEALNTHVIDFVSKDRRELMEQIDGRTVEVRGRTWTLATKAAKIVNFEMRGSQVLFDWLSDPNLLFLLMLFGFLGLFIELQSPGMVLPGLFGAVCLLAVFGIQVLPINWFGVVLVLLSAMLFIVEFYVATLGILAALGLSFLAIGSFLLFDVEGSTFRIEPLLIWFFIGPLACLMVGFGILSYVKKKQRKNAATTTLTGYDAGSTLAVPKLPNL